MIEKLLQLDRDLFLFLNGMGSETFDAFWLLVTQKSSWALVFIIIAWLLFKHLGWRHAVLICVSVALLLTLTDQSTNLVKAYFHRLRPGNNPELAHVMRIVQARNSFSFFSGHAANSMSVAVFIFLILRRYIKYVGFFFIWPIVFGYSRIYLGLHYPLDILCGFIWGSLMGLLMFELYRFARNRLFPQKKENLDNPTNT